MKAIIIGAGIGGLTTAIALQQRGIAFEIYEAAPELKTVGAGIWLGCNAMNVYEKLGLAAALKERSVLLETVFIKDTSGNTLQLVNNLEIKQLYGNATHAIHRGTLQQILVAAVRTPIQLGKKCIRIEGGTVYFEDGSTAQGDLIIGADGIRSVVREQCVTKAQYRYSGQTCWRATVNMDLPAAEQHNSGEMWSKKGGIRASASQLGDHQVYFWMTKAIPAGSRYTPADAYTLIQQELQAFPKELQEVMQRIDPEQLIHGDLYDFKPIAQWYKDEVVLIGDAAHATTPNLGQGASQAIEDAYILAAYLSKETDINAAFQKYQAKRIKHAQSVVSMSYTLGRITSLKNGIGSRLRNYLIKHTPNWIARRQFHLLYDVNLNVE
ncbi:FAD-dependent monooxygenase [Chitinophaga arvensicola]|uniref:2-polyprenyl-6-methoxyphenol hydroxylase n=1 Tax=Chitinophaga arvensicola TaxID=29529 RepID=A0A1I0S921_9BACT|nr:FAD-dependent monooxygenase [Chitinophaga arvensicola]SEW52665.1 2-polyprenyl-6-methoxyphenol hydroxylase [Chitinophaga arvensicola]